jgi:hypothetical protein
MSTNGGVSRTALAANGQAATAPAPGTECPPAFGNSDIFGASTTDPS